MKRQDPREARKEPKHEPDRPRERIVAPPIEREHETQQGVYEEDQKRERERERK